MVGDHFLGERLDVGRGAFLQRQLAGFDFGDAALGGVLDEIIGIHRQGLAGDTQQQCHE
ncbi:hypothetical protein D3C81_1873790 [compost metagenome]